MNSEDILSLALEKATKDPIYRPDFYKTLLNSLIYILTPAGNKQDRTLTYVSDGGPITIISWVEDNKKIIPIFSSLDEIKKSVKTEVGYVGINARVLFENNTEAAYILNPCGLYVKELLPNEISSLLSGTIFNDFDIVSLAKGSHVFIGSPKIYPSKIVECLKNFFSRKSLVGKAYIARIYEDKTKAPSHCVVAVSSNTDITEILHEASIILKGVLKNEEFIDFFQLGKQEDLDQYFEEIIPFYDSALK